MLLLKSPVYQSYSGPSDVSDWDVMMQRRKDAMARARKRRHRDIDITANDDHIMAMIGQMKAAAEEDRHLNMERKAATKKLQMLPTVITHLKKLEHTVYHSFVIGFIANNPTTVDFLLNVIFFSDRSDLMVSFMDCGILTALAVSYQCVCIMYNLKQLYFAGI